MWLALRFRHWGIESRCGLSTTQPVLVVETRAHRQHVVAASAAARAAGVRLGMRLADARMRLSSADIHERDPTIERAAMARLAGWAWRYSHQIHWAIADDEIECTRLILEIGASLRLFGGRQALLRRIRDDLDALGHDYRPGVGATPAAALAFARARPAIRRQGRLATLPIACLALQSDVQNTLEASGLTTTGQLLALPPGALARRFGRDLLNSLERLQGHRPHGLSLYQRPPRYNTRHELFGHVDDVQSLIFVLRRVFDDLAVFLQGADSAIQALRLTLHHEREPATSIRLQLSSPTGDARHLERVVHERLQRITLIAPVQAIGLDSDHLRHRRHHQTGLWASLDQSAGQPAWDSVLDRLRARLGQEAIGWVRAVDDHRPDRESVRQDSPPEAAERRANTAVDASPRPLWMLDTPEPIAAATCQQLTWLSGPERIESGWWDQGQRRDYYRAVDPQGRLLWIFRDLDTARQPGPAAYYLHGLFA